MPDEIYIGIDLNYERAMVSLLHSSMDEPMTVSTVSGEEKFNIPTSVFIEESSRYFYGDEAVKRKNQENGIYYTDLLRNALNDSEDNLYKECLASYILRLTRLRERFGFAASDYSIAITLPKLDKNTVEVFDYIREKLEVTEERFSLMDYGESLFEHAFHQDKTIWLHDILCLDFDGENVTSIMLHRDGGVKVQKVTPDYREHDLSLVKKDNHKALDDYFSKLVAELLKKKIVSAIFFIGNGFDGKWLKKTIKAIGHNKRVFAGKNLYTKGACYHLYRLYNEPNASIAYTCDYKLKYDVTLLLDADNRPYYFPVLKEGDNWFDKCDTVRFIYEGTPTLRFKITSSGNFNSDNIDIPLDTLPDRGDRTVRYTLTAVPTDSSHVNIIVKDDGLGEIYESTGKVFEYTIEL